MVKWPEADERTVEALRKVVMGDCWAIAQEGNSESHVELVEAALAKRIGRRYAVTMCNGSAAIVVALRALGIGPGDIVAVPALTWVACATAVHRVGAAPVFVDALPDSPLMDTSQIPSDARAILAVHLYASYTDVEKLRRDNPGIPIIEDFSHCFGAPGVGSYGHISICSFQAGKVLTCGEGGAAFTNDSNIAAIMESIRSDSRMRMPDGSMVPGIAYGENYAMSDISAALLLDQLWRLDDQCARRRDALGRFIASNETRFYIDPTAVEGAFYGVPVDSYNSGRTHPVYPPIPYSPLYRLREFRSQQWSNALKWSSRVYIPHEMFL